MPPSLWSYCLTALEFVIVMLFIITKEELMYMEPPFYPDELLMNTL